MNNPVYSIPVTLAEAYRGHAVIVRARQPAQLQALSDADLEALVHVQLPAVTDTVDLPPYWPEGIPVDFYLANPGVDFPRLYRFTTLLDRHPVRITIPVATGFSKAVKLAVALEFAVKLQIAQPTAALVDELQQVLALYLHQTTVTEPVEFFHSLLLDFFHAETATMWTIQEEDPALFRFITEEGTETLAGRSAGIAVDDDLSPFVENLKRDLLAENSECQSCPFFDHCGGYFKWPQRNYSCTNIKTIFRTLQNAAAELKKDLAAFNGSQQYSP